MNLTRFMTILAEGEAATEAQPNSAVAMLVSLAPILLIVVLMMVITQISALFDTIKQLFGLW